MARYIDAEKLIEHLEDGLRECGNPDLATEPITYGCSLGFKGALSYARTLPTADVVEVRHGKWLLDGRCSECLANPLTTHRTYCPSCGAKMDKNELLENPEQLDLRPISCGAKMDGGVTE